MKTLFSFLASLPLVLFAQKKLPFIESITSDTLNGKYQQIVFTYDQQNRVTNIFQINYKTQKTSPNDPFPLIDTIERQQFNYTKKNKNPISRKITQYEYDPVDQVSFWTSIQIQIIKYKDGKHIQDSIIYKTNRLHLVEENNIDNDKLRNWRGTINYSSKSLQYKLEFNYLKKRWGDYDRGETTELLINSQQNIEKEAREPFFKSHSSSNPPYYTFTKFDKAINPFGYLNISGILPHEKVSLTYDSKGLINTGADEAYQYDYTHFNWNYFNKNNAITYSITRGETDSPFKDVIHLSYTYNQFNLPVQCFAAIRKEFEKDGRLQSNHQKRFTFRYRE